MKTISFKHIGLKLFSFLMLIVVAGNTGGCMQPNGNIGPLFGTWAFDEITVDGEPLQGYTEGTMISFQSSIFKIESLQTYLQVYGEWTKEGNEMTLDAREEYKSGTFPAELGFEKNGVYTVTIVSDNGKKMEWRWIADDGKVWEYKLRKLI